MQPRMKGLSLGPDDNERDKRDNVACVCPFLQAYWTPFNLF